MADKHVPELLAALEDMVGRVENMLRGKVSALPIQVIKAKEIIAKVKRERL